MMKVPFTPPRALRRTRDQRAWKRSCLIANRKGGGFSLCHLNMRAGVFRSGAAETFSGDDSPTRAQDSTKFALKPAFTPTGDHQAVSFRSRRRPP
jgi:hypothetical protein